MMHNGGMRARGWFVAVSLALVAPACQAPLNEVRAAPAFELPDLAGGKLSLSELKGKMVVLDFWATWCGPCIKEIPDYAEFWRKNRGRGVEVIGVVCDSGEPSEIQDFVREYKIPYRQLLGDEEVQAAFGALQGFPTTFVIDGQGVIRKKMLGSPPGKFEALQKLVDEALAAR
jgi:peroxiredoxin